MERPFTITVRYAAAQFVFSLTYAIFSLCMLTADIIPRTSAKDTMFALFQNVESAL